MTQADRDMLLMATEAARARMRDERDSWPDAERDDGPVHISVVIAEWLAMHGLPPISEPALSRCGEGV